LAELILGSYGWSLRGKAKSSTQRKKNCFGKEICRGKGEALFDLSPVVSEILSKKKPSACKKR